ncbi:hypothetical protein MPER_05212, partial [Moniliophthora perniciosa FA553]
SPVVRPRKRIKKMVLDSHEEEDVDSSSDEESPRKKSRQENADEVAALDFFNVKGPEALQELTGCTPEQANTIIGLRPFRDAEDLSSRLTSGVPLKDYQLLGVNWLHLLYSSGYSCILADEMGLGKTIQVISFFAYLKEKGNKGPHLVVVPSSTLENWCREFARFAPSVYVQTYYAGKEERVQLRQTLLDSRGHKRDDGKGWDVLITTYNLAQSDADRKFFRKIQWDSCVFDEGHVLKNFQSQRYKSLLRVESRWRLLLTGTPLQNNLQELVETFKVVDELYFAQSIR